MPELHLTNSDSPAILSREDIEAAQVFTWYDHGSRGIMRGHDKLTLLQFIGQRMGFGQPFRVAKGRDYTRANFKDISLRPVLASDLQDEHAFIVSPEDLEYFRGFQWKRQGRLPSLRGSRDSIFTHLAERMGLVKCVQFVNNNDFRRENIKGNPIIPEIVDGKCRLPVALGVFTTIDARDYDWAKETTWSLTGNGYATGKTSLHREVLERHGVLAPEHVDHKNRDPLDNTFANLRPATRVQNRKNTIMPSMLGLKGVDAQKRRFRARLRIENARGDLGAFATSQHAANAHDIAAVFTDYEFIPRNSEGPWGLPNGDYDKLVAKLNSFGLNVPTEVVDESEIEVIEWT